MTCVALIEKLIISTNRYSIVLNVFQVLVGKLCLEKLADRLLEDITNKKALSELNGGNSI